VPQAFPPLLVENGQPQQQADSIPVQKAFPLCLVKSMSSLGREDTEMRGLKQHNVLGDTSSACEGLRDAPAACPSMGTEHAL
jgi:hypothetical protein